MTINIPANSQALRLPDVLAGIGEIARNLWWSWQPEAVALFREADPGLFERSGHNPMLLLGKLSAARKRALAADEVYLARVNTVHRRMRDYLDRARWYDTSGGRTAGITAYFCMEYALHESLPMYAGGLGVLAGDHLKSCSDLGLPFLAIGMYWHKGYTRQRIGAKGEQQDRFLKLSPKDAPVAEVTAKHGRPLRVDVPLGDETIKVKAWRMMVGRVPLLLLDTDIPENPPRHRRICEALYSGDRDTRIRQEIVLGIGGWRVLKALKVKVAACHLNEGHAAFLSLERVSERIKARGETFKQACGKIAATSVFTTHTPVPDGNETFEHKLVAAYMRKYANRLRLTNEEFHDLGRVKAGDSGEPFGMTPLALKTSRYANGVAALHGQVARKMWKGLYPKRKLNQVPIGHVTNGIHLPTWIHPLMAHTLTAYLGPDWLDHQDRQATWKKVEQIPDAELWSLHQQFKAELITYCRERLHEQLKRSKVPGMKAADADRLFSPEALTIGFARRFASYKRATLIFRDAGRLARILNDTDRPVQLIFAGKAHPADSIGKALVQEIVRHSREPRFRRRVLLLEDYDMDVARHMVAGCDVWLNNPQRPQEASGTSGMKPTLHGGLNLSILDGWWPEGYNGRNGWAIGRGKDHDGTAAADKRDVEDLYKTLTRDVVPLYYKRDRTGLPTAWIARMKNAMMSVPPEFNMNRQVKEYLTKYYAPAMRAAGK